MNLLEEIKNIESGKKKLREFGLTVGGAFLLFGAIAWWRGKPFYPYLLSLSAFLMIFGLLLPVVLKPVQKVWMSLALMMGWVMTRVLLSLLFYLAVTPIGLLARVFGKDFLDEKFKEPKESYWNYRPEVQPQKSDYEKQF